MDFDSQVVPRTGGFGRHNWRLAAITWVPNIVLALSFYSELFFTWVPTHECRPDVELLPAWLHNLTVEALRNVSLPVKEELRRCQLYRYGASIEGTAEELLNNRSLVPCTRGWDYGAVAGLDNNVVTKWNLVCHNSWKVPLEQISYTVGWIAGYLALGFACDRLGRRTTFVVSLVLAVLFGFGVAVSLDPIMFLLLRVFQGMALAGVFLSIYIIRLELCDPPHRLMITMIGGLFAVAGQLLLPALAVLCRDWRILQGVITFLLLLLTLYGCFPIWFPESARWLLSTCQFEKCKKVLQSFAEGNGENLEDELYSQDHLFSEIDSLYEGRSQVRYHVICEVVNTRVIWRNSLILGFTTFIGSGVQHCFTQNLFNYHPEFYFRYFIRSTMGGVSCIALCLTANRLGRRAVLLISTIVTGVTSLLLLALTQYLFPEIVLALSVVGILASHAVAMLSIFFASEVIPTVVRGAGIGLIMAVGFVGRAAAPIMDIHNNDGFFLRHVVFASFAVLSVLCIMLLPETKRKNLPEGIKDGENLRRPSMFHSRNMAGVPLLSPSKKRSDYNPENYSLLMTTTKKMLSREKMPFVAGQYTKVQSDENQDMKEDS